MTDLFDVNEAVKELKLLRCKGHYTNDEILKYHTCLNVIEETLCEGNIVVIDLDEFDSDSPEQCYKVIQKSKN